MPDSLLGIRRLLVVQYAGDYAEAWRRLKEGGAENYLAQSYSVNAIAYLASAGAEVAVVVAVTDFAYRIVLEERLLAVGLGASRTGTEEAVVAFAREFRPTHLLLRTPFTSVLRWACEGDVRTLLTLADSFPGGLRHWIRSRRMARLMNSPAVDWVTNHGIASSQALVSMGVDPSKVIPWDWPHLNTPEQWSSKHLPPGKQGFKLLYVGARVELKGVGDAIRALALLVKRGQNVRLEVIGEGEDFSAEATKLKIAERVVFRGRVANESIIREMHEADLVLVPSRKEYPEGFPLTIYEALCSRTPIVASDHPMFLPTLRADSSAVLFRAGDAKNLSRSIERLLADPALYASLSQASLATWQSLQVNVKWAELVRAWFDGGSEAGSWLRGNSMDRARGSKKLS